MSLPISGFTAVPNPQMLAFMAAQSFIMMMQAGEGWQYGKRKQSAMTNEEFNKQTPLSIMQRQMSELKQAIPTISQSMNQMTPMISQIVTQYGAFIAEAVKALPQVASALQGGQTLTGNISTVGQEFADIAKSLADAIGNFQILPEASASSGGSSNIPGLTNIQYGNLGDTGPPDPSQEIIMYQNMTRTQLLNSQPSQVAWIKNSPDFSKHVTAWNIAYAKFTATDSPPAELLPDPSVATKNHRIQFRGRNPKVINSSKTFMWNVTQSEHELNLKSMRQEVENLLKFKSPSYWPIKAMTENIRLYSLAYKSFYGKWA